jgi:hypothetical protein
MRKLKDELDSPDTRWLCRACVGKKRAEDKKKPIAAPYVPARCVDVLGLL